MLSFEELFFGYYDINLDPSDSRGIAVLALKRGASVKIDPDGRVRLSTLALHRLGDALNPSVRALCKNPRGIGGAVLNARRHIPSLVALFLVVLLQIFLSNLIFDVRVSGNEHLSESEVISELSQAGLSVGDSWSKIDKNEVELRLLSTSERVGWISINRVGSVAEVRIIERASLPPPAPDSAPANIVAERDCVIEEIIVNAGRAMVKVGDTVRRGDILISGIVESEGGTTYVRADGVVRGSTSELVKSEMSRISTEISHSEGKISSLAVKIFKFRVNIFKRYGNSDDSCVIIESVKECSLFGKRLPLTLFVTRVADRSERSLTLSDGELVERALSEHRAAIAALTENADLLKIRTSGEYTTDGYKMESRVVISVEIGVSQRIDMEETNG